jgi:Tol biopolymer transport system component
MLGVAVAGGLWCPSVEAQIQTTLVGPAGDRPALSADGRYVAFESSADDLVTNDTNNHADVFVYDRVSGTTERVSVNTDGVAGNGASDDPDISGDGRYVVFVSSASNLVDNDTNGVADVFVHDRETRATTRVSVDSAGLQGNAESRRPSISADGRVVALSSSASNLVPADTNAVTDVFVHELAAGTTARVSVGAAGQADGWSGEPSINADGRFIAFVSFAPNLVNDDPVTNHAFVHDRVTGATTAVMVDTFGFGLITTPRPSISADGRFVAFESQSWLPFRFLQARVHVHDRQTGSTTLVSINGEDVAISADGRFVVFRSGSNNGVDFDTNDLLDIFVYDQVTGAMSLVSVGGVCWALSRSYAGAAPAISADGRFVAFQSGATNLDPGRAGAGVFLHDRQAVPSCSARAPLPAGDYDRDGRDDVTVYRPSTGWWYVIPSTTATSWHQQWGEPGDVPVGADYDGDGKQDLAVYRRATGTWYVIYSSTSTAWQMQWGWSMDIPVPADYDGDGRADIAVFRPLSGIYYIWQSRDNTRRDRTWGIIGDVPVPRDYDGDGLADPAVYRPSTGRWHLSRSATSTGEEVQWGIAGDQPMPGDYDGDGRTDVAVYRPSTGMWYVIRSSTGTGWEAQWGWPGDQPIVGDYDGDGRADPTVFRPSTGQWFSRGTGFLGFWGLPQDIPQ